MKDHERALQLARGGLKMLNGGELCTSVEGLTMLAIERFQDLDDALAKANTGPYALATSVWTRDDGTATRFANGIKSGTVWINCFHQYDIAVPWGSVKTSGVGRERGAESFEHLLDKKVVWRNG